jgi:hypothetical protein
LKNQINTKNALIAGFFTCLIAYAFLKLGDFSISDFSKLYISQATLDNVEIGKRVSLFFRSTIIGFICLPLFYKIIQRIKTKWDVTEKELLPLSVISFIGIFMLFTDVIGIKSDSSIKFIAFYSIYSLITLLIERKNKSTIPSLFHHPIIISASILITSGMLLILNGKTNFREIGIVGYFVTEFILSIIIQYIQKKKQIESKIIFWYLVPLCLIPLFIFGTIEVTFFVKLKYDFFLPFKWIFVGLISVIYLIYLIFPLNKKLKAKSNYQLTAYYFVPAALVSCLIFIYYYPYIDQPIDIFELANPANAQLQIFKFSEIPFVDFMSSHMFSEQFYGVIYNLIYGYSGKLDFMSYTFLSYFVYYLLVYFFLLKLTKSPFYILSFLVFFPFLTILINNHLFVSIIILFSVHLVIKKQTIKNYLLLFFWTISLFFWRLDTGTAGLLSLVLFLPIIFYTSPIKLNLKSLIQSLSIAVLFGIGIVSVVLFFRTPDELLNNFQNALHYASAAQGHGYSHLSSFYPQQFYILYLLFPIIAIASILYSIVRLKNVQENRFITYSLQASIFLFLIFLTNFQRGLVRYGFFEYNHFVTSSTFYIALVLLLISFVNSANIAKKMALFATISYLLVLILQYFQLNHGMSKLDSLLTDSKIRKIDTYLKNDEFKGKIIDNEEFAKENYLSFKRFMNDHYDENKTFMDFSNTPMLYFNTQRNVPSYFCQNLQNTIDDFSQLQHIKTIPTSKVPVVVYSNYPTTWFDRTDEVPNAMRQYLIAEYIYKHYKPFGIINKHSIWVSKNSKIKNEGIEKDTLITQPQVYHYKNAAAFMYNHFIEENLKSIQKLKMKSFNSPDTSANYSVSISKKINQLSGVLMSVELDHNIPNSEIKLELVKNKEIVGTVLFTTNEKDKKYMVRISNQYFWFLKQPSSIQLTKLAQYKVKSISFYKDLRNGY